MATHKKALSIRQPWAWLIANGYKDIENRSWATTFRGEIFIHASKGMTRKEYEECDLFTYNLLPSLIIPHRKELCYGGIIGAVTISDCVTESESPWFTGKFGFALENPRTLPFMPCPGTLGFFYPSY